MREVSAKKLGLIFDKVENIFCAILERYLYVYCYFWPVRTSKFYSLILVSCLWVERDGS